MRKSVLCAICALALAFPAAASAAWDGQGNSTPGGDRYDAIAANPNPDAQCGWAAGSGAFGYFGKDMNLAGGEGMEGGKQTGLNNSALCGNRPDN